MGGQKRGASLPVADLTRRRGEEGEVGAAAAPSIIKAEEEGDKVLAPRRMRIEEGKVVCHLDSHFSELHSLGTSASQKVINPPDWWTTAAMW